MDSSFLWLAISAGALSLLTPCVFPMVPITVSYFTHHAGAGRASAAQNAAVFAGGIIATFTALGVALAVFVGATGISRFAAHPWVNVAIAVMFLVFALNLLGYYEISVPSGLLNRLDAVTRNGGSNGTVGALLMGVMFTLTSFTCTAPFVGTLLVMASQGEWQRPVVGMLAFSATFALPFFGLALAPHALARLPRSGGWLNSVKVVMGFLEIAAALKFLSNADLVLGWGVFTRPVVLVAWALLAGLVAVYLIGKLTFPNDTPLARLSLARGALAAIFLIGGGWLGSGLNGRPMGELESFLPPRAADTPEGLRAAARGRIPGELLWHVNALDSARAIARAEDRRVFIDFTGYTCTNCRWMEANMFTIPEVRAELGKFVLARLLTDGEGDVYERQQEYQKTQFGTIALPLYAVVDGNGKTVATFAGLTRSREEFIEFLKGALASTTGRSAS